MERIKYAYAAVAGTNHLYNDLPCQDYVLGKEGKEGYCVALADGAGSVEKSHLSAEIAVKCIADELSENFYQWFKKETKKISEDLVELCSKKVRLSKYNIDADCTLLVIAISKEGDVIIGHIGDGAIFAVDCFLNSTIISEPENGNNQNETYFVSHIDAANHFRIQKTTITEYKGFILCSDGIEKSLFSKRENKHAIAIKRIVEWCDKYPTEVVSARLEKELDEVFRGKSVDDMSIGVISVNGES